MASTWIVVRTTKAGERRYRVEFRLGGREAPARYGGSFKRKRDAEARKRWIGAELAERRVPDLRSLEPTAQPQTVAAACQQWLGSRIDVAESTKTRNGLEVDRICRLLGGSRLDELTPAVVASFVAKLAEDYSRSTIRKNLQTLQMVLDNAGGENPARDKRVRLPRGADEEINPPTAEHVEAVFRLLPSKHRIPFLWLDWSGARVSSIDLTLVGDYDEPRRRVRLRAATTKTRKLSGSICIRRLPRRSR